MQTRKPQLLAAIGAALQEYLLEEEAARAAAAVVPAAPAGPPVNVWALAGRQTAMQWRLLAQRRALR